jgi:hypothetical protein
VEQDSIAQAAQSRIGRVAHIVAHYGQMCFVESTVMSNLAGIILKISRRFRISSEKRLLTSSCLSARISVAPIVRIFVKFYIWDFQSNLLSNSKFD